MDSIIFSKQRFFIILGVVTLFSLGPFVYFLFNNSNRDNLTVLSKQAKAELSTSQIGKPVRITIPSIGVDAFIENAGLNLLGEMDVPKNPRNVSWFDLGPRPGEKGSAVVAGHFGWKNNIPAVFDNLYKLKKGDELFIEDKNGLIIAFTVLESRIYFSQSDASKVFNTNDGNSNLNIVTCEGVWDKISKSYSGRLVVFTIKNNK